MNWRNLFFMSQSEIQALNPPFTPEVAEDETGRQWVSYSDSEGWLYVGHIPTPKTRLGWFAYNVIHGLAMRYRLLPVLVFSVRDLFVKQSDRVVDVTLVEEYADDSQDNHD